MWFKGKCWRTTDNGRRTDDGGHPTLLAHRWWAKNEQNIRLNNSHCQWWQVKVWLGECVLTWRWVKVLLCECVLTWRWVKVWVCECVLTWRWVNLWLCECVLTWRWVYRVRAALASSDRWVRRPTHHSACSCQTPHPRYSPGWWQSHR